MINVLLFASLAEKVGKQNLELEAAGKSVVELLDGLTVTYPNLTTELQQAMIAINEEFVPKHTIIREHDTVAVIPPVSGG